MPYVVDDHVIPFPHSRRLPPGTKFADVEGVPVALIPTLYGGLSVRAFDNPTGPGGEPRGFPLDSVSRNGSMISSEAFDSLVMAQSLAGRCSQHRRVDYEHPFKQLDLFRRPPGKSILDLPQIDASRTPLPNPPQWVQDLVDNLNRNVLAGVMTS